MIDKGSWIGSTRHNSRFRQGSKIARSGSELHGLERKSFESMMRIQTEPDLGGRQVGIQREASNVVLLKVLITNSCKVGRPCSRAKVSASCSL